MANTSFIPFKFLNAALDMEDKCFENESINADIAALWRGLETMLSRPLFHLYAAIESLIGISHNCRISLKNQCQIAALEILAIAEAIPVFSALNLSLISSNPI